MVNWHIPRTVHGSPPVMCAPLQLRVSPQFGSANSSDTVFPQYGTTVPPAGPTHTTGSDPRNGLVKRYWIT